MSSGRWRRWLALGLWLAAAGIAPQAARAQFELAGDEGAESRWNLPLKTLGGYQYWTDVRHHEGWRIQKNSLDGHFRLIDRKDVRRAWGSRQACEEALDELAGELGSHDGPRRVVILLHGLVRTRNSMDDIAERLEREGRYQIVNFQYASTQHTVAEHAQALAEVIEGLGPGIVELNFVAHSLGNLVVRHYLADSQRTAPDPRWRRMVMLGPPNRGSRLARSLQNSWAFRLTTGVSGAQLAGGWTRLESQLATPSFEFGIVAGGDEDVGRLEAMLFQGPHDFTVAVEETKLAGARDFLMIPVKHADLMSDPRALEAIVEFLQSGRFDAERSPRPLRPEDLQPMPGGEIDRPAKFPINNSGDRP